MIGFHIYNLLFGSNQSFLSFKIYLCKLEFGRLLVNLCLCLFYFFGGLLSYGRCLCLFSQKVCLCLLHLGKKVFMTTRLQMSDENCNLKLVRLFMLQGIVLAKNGDRKYLRQQRKIGSGGFMIICLMKNIATSYL